MCNMRGYELEYMLSMDMCWKDDVPDDERLNGTDILIKKRIAWIIDRIIHFKEAEAAYNAYLNDTEHYNERGKKTKKHFYEISGYRADDLKGSSELETKYKDIILRTVALKKWDIENMFVFEADDSVIMDTIVENRRNHEEMFNLNGYENNNESIKEAVDDELMTGVMEILEKSDTTPDYIDNSMFGMKPFISESECFDILYQMTFDYHKEQSRLSCLQNTAFVNSIFYNMKVVRGRRPGGRFIIDDIILHVAEFEQEDRIYDQLIDEGIVLKFNCIDLATSNDKLNNVFKTWLNIISAGDWQEAFVRKLTMMKDHFNTYKPADYDESSGEMSDLPPHSDPIVETLIRLSDTAFDDLKIFLEKPICERGYIGQAQRCLYLYFTDIQYLLENDIAAKKFIRMWYNIKSEFHHHLNVKLVLGVTKSIYEKDDMLLMKIKRLDKEFKNISVFE